MKSLPFHRSHLWKRYPFLVELPRMRHSPLQWVLFPRPPGSKGHQNAQNGFEIAREPQTYFRSSLLSLRNYLSELFFGGREATTGNTSKWLSIKSELTVHKLKKSHFYFESFKKRKPFTFSYKIQIPFYSGELSILAFEWMWVWRWPCFDTNLLCFVMESTCILEKYYSS